MKQVDAQKKARAARLRQEQTDNRLSSESRARSQAKRRSNETVKEEAPLLYEIFKIIPNKWRGVFFGAVLGLIAAVVILLSSPDGTRMLALVPLILFPLLGLVVGSAISRK